MEKVYWENGYFYDLREVLSPKLLEQTRAEVRVQVPEKYVREAEVPPDIPQLIR